MNDFFEIFCDPKKEIFWTASGTILAISIALGSLFTFIYNSIIKNKVSERTKIIIDGQIEIFTNWVKVRSKSQQIDEKNIEEWLSDLGGVVNLGRNYVIYRKFIEKLNEKENKNIQLMNEDKFNNLIKDFDNAPKWSRIEW
ncbi:hypothetical protein [Flavobacterium sp. UBA6135]|uniref:hypothetical protein n=1 Tax=Flavobacterium sp. UBA6135 TaxID=1946553 RepID=UPI0025C65A65|nr:hypothetical protein [Flavobacterium sp. UBA6135]